MPDLRLEKEAHVLRVRVEVGIGGEGVVADPLQAIRDAPAPRARVRRLAGLLQEAVGELQRQEALVVAGRLFGHGVTTSRLKQNFVNQLTCQFIRDVNAFLLVLQSTL